MSQMSSVLISRVDNARDPLEFAQKHTQVFPHPENVAVRQCTKMRCRSDDGSALLLSLCSLSSLLLLLARVASSLPALPLSNVSHTVNMYTALASPVEVCADRLRTVQKFSQFPIAI